MLANREETGVRIRLDEELSRNPSLSTVIDVVAEHAASFAIDTSVGGLEIVPLNQIKGGPTRCRLKLFRPREEKDRVCAFFYKRSNLSFSRDRYSYGAVEFLPGTLARDEIRAWLDWLQSGFDPDRRPLRLRRAFPYTIPE